ncbi:MAG: PDZ domain-containing protein [Aristaeellaceae bacterium]
MKRWHMIAAAVLVVAVVAGAWLYLSRPALPSGITSAAELGLMLLDTEEGLSVLAVRENSAAEQAGIHPGDVLLTLNDAPLSTVDMLDDCLLAGREATLLLQLQRGSETGTVRLWLPAD